jgi:hypothetical protein
MGVALWLVCGLLAFAVAAVMKPGGALSWPLELSVAAGAALLFGLAATALDFGGWKELEWRAGLFCFFGSAAVLAITRLSRSLTAGR